MVFIRFCDERKGGSENMGQRMLTGDDLVYAAESIAIQAHTGQVDKNGEPYIAHPARVVSNVYDVVAENAEVLEAEGVSLEDGGVMADLYAVAYLHDVIEDSEYSYDDLVIRGIPVSVADSVMVISKRENEPLDEYYERVRGDLFARIVKLADVRDNTDPHRLAQIADAETRQRLRVKYEKAENALRWEDA